MAELSGVVDGRLLGGRYRMGALLAAGGMGEVWAARDLLLDRAVAVKVLGGALAGDGRAAERLRREARAAGRLEHPGIARVLDLGEHDGRPYLVMELLEGESLAARIGRAGPLPPAEAARIVAAVADALEAAHRAGVVHRDVKPGNVFLTSDGEVKVLDFGIASAAGETALTTGDLLGTAAYLAPERVLGHRATPAADIYALGVVLYELLAGRRPFEADSELGLAMAHVNAEPPPLRQAAPSTPAFLAAASGHAMAKDPAARPPSAAALAGQVRGVGPAVGAGVGPTSYLTRPLPPAAASRTATRPFPVAVASRTSGRRSPAATAAGPPRSRGLRSRWRGLLVALVLAGAVLAVLPALAGVLPPWAGERVEPPFVVQVPDGGKSPVAGDPGQGVPDRPDRRDDDRDRGDDSRGSGRSGEDGDSSGPG